MTTAARKQTIKALVASDPTHGPHSAQFQIQPDDSIRTAAAFFHHVPANPGSTGSTGSSGLPTQGDVVILTGRWDDDDTFLADWPPAY